MVRDWGILSLLSIPVFLHWYDIYAWCQEDLEGLRATEGEILLLLDCATWMLIDYTLETSTWPTKECLVSTM